MKRLLSLLLLCALSLSAQVLISPLDAINSAYPKNTSIEKKNYILKKDEAVNVSKSAKTKLSSKIFKVYKALKNDKVIAYGILINKKVRSKNAVVMYLINADSTLKGIEIIAFNEPLEYIPSKTWKSQFQNISTEKMLQLSQDIPTITGATLSARTITDGSRLAFAFYNEILKTK